MDYYSSKITALIEEFSRLPGIGAKTAQRLAFHVVSMPEEQVKRLAASLLEAKEGVRYCKECFTLTDSELCPICASDKRECSVRWRRPRRSLKPRNLPPRRAAGPLR